MLAIAIVDSRRYIIPNALTGAAVALALLRAGYGRAGCGSARHALDRGAGRGAGPGRRSWD